MEHVWCFSAHPGSQLSGSFRVCTTTPEPLSAVSRWCFCCGLQLPLVIFTVENKYIVLIHSSGGINGQMLTARMLGITLNMR